MLEVVGVPAALGARGLHVVLLGEDGRPGLVLAGGVRVDVDLAEWLLG